MPDETKVEVITRLKAERRAIRISFSAAQRRLTIALNQEDCDVTALRLHLEQFAAKAKEEQDI